MKTYADRNFLKKSTPIILGGKRKAKIPANLDFGILKDSIGAQHTVRRYIAKAERIMLNVTKGEFPGRYE